MPNPSPRPIVYVSGTATATTTPTSLYTLIVADMVAKGRTADLNSNTVNGVLTYTLDFSAFRAIFIAANSGTINYGDQYTSTTVGFPIISTNPPYWESSFAFNDSLDITQRFLCATTGSPTFSYQIWRG